MRLSVAEMLSILINYSEKSQKLGFFSSQTKVIGSIEKMFEENEGVRLKRDLPYNKLKAGMIGTAVYVYGGTPPWGYEVEFSDENGVPLGYDPNYPESFLTVTLHEEDLEPVDDEKLKKIHVGMFNRLLYEGKDTTVPAVMRHS